jgi:predicted DNA-binding protein (UPF0251 family)
MMHRGRRRRGRRGRPPSPVYINHLPRAREFIPAPRGDEPPIQLEPAELEALRLVDLEDLSQEEAGKRMGVSRGTVWRLLQEARRKVTQALVEGRPIRITPPQES